MTDDPKRPLKVFLCHAHPDAAVVRALYARLKADGVDAWLDKEKIIPGQDWEFEIRRAVRENDIVIVCLSKQFDQKGYRQNEVRIALDEANLQPEGTIFIIPARLEECDYLESLRRFHGVDLFEPEGYDRLMRALRLRADKIGAVLQSKKGWLDGFTSPTPAITLTATNDLQTDTNMPFLSDEITDAKGITMRLVPAGTFMMGSETFFDNEKPIHEVYLDSYYMDIYEVTNAVYKKCVDVGTCKPPIEPNEYNDSKYADHPVVNVIWNMAKTYCEWRSARLPTEAEWEKAARGMDGRTYPWGEDLSCDKANYTSNCVGYTTKVGSYESGKSPYGMYDMVGNVSEWVNDWYSDYQNLPVSNPLGPDSGTLRVLRGGSWVGDFDYLLVRSAFRDVYAPDDFTNIVGFRCARSQ